MTPTERHRSWVKITFGLSLFYVLTTLGRIRGTLLSHVWHQVGPLDFVSYGGLGVSHDHPVLRQLAIIFHFALLYHCPLLHLLWPVSCNKGLSSFLLLEPTS